ncbi:Histidine phosphatase superfamily [Carpediemonas membranifera]|uniref:Histidine phosphatase superfamily n=1 Tax=Carpediemonas membranifera TaxID=201153 RepID=A0A8J6E4Y9_9EUKA|nr:Histidine phosphatase superfamily [Carpediemonas membranifera]|eukprot:KAG9397526.1 Histidine phosphatase superfamily [Carpediemonas membranifera]
MFKLAIFVAFALFITQVLAEDGSSSDGALELVAAQIITRHGARSPAWALPASVLDYKNPSWHCDAHTLTWYDDGSVIPNSPLFKLSYDAGNGTGHHNDVPGNCQQGQLTVEGGKMHYDLGVRVRERYVSTLGLLPATLTPELMYLRTTDIQRTKASLEHQISGIYPNSRGTVLDVHTIDLSGEYLFSPDGTCPRREKLEADITSSLEWDKYFAAIEPVRVQLCEAWSAEDCAQVTWMMIFDNVATRQAHGIPLPPGVDSKIAQIATNAAEFNWGLKNSNGELRSLYIGEFLAELVHNFVAVSRGATPVKWFAYSGHDATVGPLVQVLNGNAQPFIWPPYAADVILELWTKGPSSWFIRATYQGELLRMPACGNQEYCPMDDFITKVAAPVVPPNMAWQCAHPDDTMWPYTA